MLENHSASRESACLAREAQDKQPATMPRPVGAALPVRRLSASAYGDLRAGMLHSLRVVLRDTVAVFVHQADGDLRDGRADCLNQPLALQRPWQLRADLRQCEWPIATGGFQQ